MTPEYADQLIAWYGADTGNYDEYDANDDDDMATYVAAWEDENYDIEHIEVDEIEQVTDTSVRIIGKIEYEPDGMSETDTEMDSFIIEATINPESIFGGYTFNTMYIFDTEEVANDYFKLEEDSWKNIISKAGYEVQTVLKGLGEYESIRKLFVEHAREAV